MDKVERVTMDVRVADLFRQYKQNPSKSVMTNVLENLAVMGLPGSVLARFPGFIQLVADLASTLNKSELSADEVVKLSEVLVKIGIHNREKSAIDMASLAEGFSNQLVSVMDSINKPDLAKTVYRLEKDMKLKLDSYMYWALNKEMGRWATEASVPEQEFIQHVLGAVQLLAQPPVVQHMGSLFSSADLEGKMIDLIKTERLNSLQTIQLIVSLKSQFPQMAQVGISAVIRNYHAKLESSITDLNVLTSALPVDGSKRDFQVQASLVGILLTHLSKKLEVASDVHAVLDCVAQLIVDPSNEAENQVLALAAKLVLENPLVVSAMDPDQVANLYYQYAMGVVSTPEDDSESRELFRSVCRQTESDVVGRLPRISPTQLSRLSLSFASGIVHHTNSFKALAATIRRSASLFTPSAFTDACYGLAFGGLLSRSILVDGDVVSVVPSVPIKSVPKLAWSVAVAGYSIPVMWEALMSRIENEILLKPRMLQRLTPNDECILYELLVAMKYNQHASVSKNAMRRIAQFEASWKPPVSPSEVDYDKVLGIVNVAYDKDVVLADKFAMLKIPIYIPEYKLILDVTKDPVSIAGATNGSCKLRHSIWANLGYNVIAISDSQFATASDDTEKASVLGGIISQFVLEIQSVKSTDPAPKQNNAWDSRPKPDYAWDSRADSKTARPRASAKPRSNNWTSRIDE